MHTKKSAAVICKRMCLAGKCPRRSECSIAASNSHCLYSHEHATSERKYIPPAHDQVAVLIQLGGMVGDDSVRFWS